MRDDARVIGVDWGSTHLRAWLLETDGTVVDSLSADQGILFGRAEDLRAALADHLAAWLGDGVGLVIGAGMLGSRTGIVDAGYCDLPLTRESWLEAVFHAGDVGGVPLAILPGAHRHWPDPDVMRGEELQVFAALADGAEDGVFVCPGTHSKWLTTKDGAITDFRTYVTGELYAHWSAASSLTGLLTEQRPSDAALAFGIGVSASAGNVMAGLFQLRAAVLEGLLDSHEALDALSGLLIAAEIHDAAPRMPLGRVRLLGAPALTDRYARVLTALHIDAEAIEIHEGRALGALASALSVTEGEAS